MNVILFFGAGVSKKSGLPLVSEIEDVLLNGNFIFENNNFFKSLKSDDTVLEIQKFLRQIKTLDEYYLQTISPRKTNTGIAYSGALYRSSNNYEVLYYICKQIYLESLGLTDLPMIGSFIEKLSGTTFNNVNNIDSILQIEKLALKGILFIDYILNDMLNIQIDEIVGFDFILELYQSALVDRITFITLNHDMLLENYLEQNDITYCDGFQDSNFGDNRFIGFNTNSKVTVIKPHGSLNWTSNIQKTEFCKNKIGVKSPLILTGADKVEHYNYSIFKEMIHEITKILRRDNIMIMSGYGWGDAAMNGRIAEWINNSTNKLIFLYNESWKTDEYGMPERKGIIANSIFIEGLVSGIPNKTDGLYLDGRLIKIDKYLCEAKLSDIKQFLC